MANKFRHKKTAKSLSLIAMLGLSFVLTMAVPPAMATSGFGWAYVWGNVANGTPHMTYQFNSTGPTAINKIVSPAAGEYEVYLPGLGARAGIAHATAYGSGSETCKIVGWGPSASDPSTQLVVVRCFNKLGNPANTQFTMTYAHPASSPKPMAFLWSDQASATTETTPTLAYQFNSTGATNRVIRNSLGFYTALLPGLGSQSGHVQVTAYGTGSERCKVDSWAPADTTQRVNVRCFSVAGEPADSLFTLTYVSQISMVGSPCCSGGPGTAGGYVWANEPTTKSYIPSAPYQFNVTLGAVNTVKRLDIGVYQVSFPFQNVNRGNVQVTAYGSGSEYCKVGHWFPGDDVRVYCYSNAGVPVNTQFVVTFLDSFLIG